MFLEPDEGKSPELLIKKQEHVAIATSIHIDKNTELCVLICSI